MDLKIEKAENREGFGKERYEKKSLQEEVRKIFFTLKEKDSCNKWKILDASQTIEELHEQIVKFSLELIEKCNQLPLTDLS